MGAVAFSLSTYLLYERENRNPNCSHPYLLLWKIGENGDLQMLQWLYSRNRLRLSHVRVRLIKSAAQGGRLDMMKWARANGWRLDDEICVCAAEGGHLNMLKWLRANGCSWDEHTCAGASKGGHLEVLKWARANGCDWNTMTCFHAAQNGHLEVLRWARANGAPWSPYWCTVRARNKGHDHIVQWIVDNR